MDPTYQTTYYYNPTTGERSWTRPKAQEPVGCAGAARHRRKGLRAGWAGLACNVSWGWGGMGEVGKVLNWGSIPIWNPLQMVRQQAAFARRLAPMSQRSLHAAAGRLQGNAACGRQQVLVWECRLYAATWRSQGNAACGRQQVLMWDAACSGGGGGGLLVFS